MVGAELRIKTADEERWRETPLDSKAPPKNAMRAASGLSMRIE
jgi:hypothetical protein